MFVLSSLLFIYPNNVPSQKSRPVFSLQQEAVISSLSRFSVFRQSDVFVCLLLYYVYINITFQLQYLASLFKSALGKCHVFFSATILNPASFSLQSSTLLCRPKG